MINKLAISAIIPFTKIWWEGTIILEDGNFRVSNPKETPDLYSVCIRRVDDSIQCLADFLNADQAQNFIDMFKALETNYIKEERIKYYLFGSEWVREYEEGGVDALRLSSGGTHYSFDEKNQSSSEFAEAIIGRESFVEISKEEFIQITKIYGEV